MRNNRVLNRGEALMRGQRRREVGLLTRVVGGDGRLEVVGAPRTVRHVPMILYGVA